MRFEWMIGTRYLQATRQRGAPSVITIVSVGAVAVGVAALILVLAVLGGFEGDLRNKILGTKAHILLTGEGGGELADFRSVLEAVNATPGIAGAVAFVESDVMMASATNYSGAIIRGVDPNELRTATEIDAYMRDGSLEWLDDSEAALELRRRRLLGDSEAEVSPDALREMAEQLRRDVDRLEAEVQIARALREGSGGALAIAAPAGSGTESSPTAGERPEAGGPSLRDPLAEARASDGSGASRGGAAEGVGADGSGDEGAPSRPRSIAERIAAGRRAEPRVLPGVVIGTELAETLHVEVGDQVQVINPDGDLGPTGPIPRVWQYRVVGTFYTGFFEYDNAMAYLATDSARRFLNVSPDVATAIEIKITDLDRVDAVAGALRSALAASGRSDVEVSTWEELNSSLFAALQLEQVVIGLVLMIIVLVASFAIACVLTMIVIQRSDEIAVMRAMGADAAMVQRVFFVQGLAIGTAGTALGLAFGLGVVWLLRVVGFPLDPEIYYIDRLPVELASASVVAVVCGSLLISAVATLLPSVQAARLDPAAALRHD
ncbi:MAG: FtsX-like permease family protein [Myxococcales bacterium]|nr:FtsX-like permease family protein [Myxococcales bacterium]MCB9520606.1 FtsX-like permease family protein [Myxococcales bacterium]MCB9531529.1 FtsX-like permease family protein [Myxococcales bacterium]